MKGSTEVHNTLWKAAELLDDIATASANSRPDLVKTLVYEVKRLLVRVDSLLGIAEALENGSK